MTTEAEKIYDQLILDIFTTAIEGGINYWSWTDEYKWMNEDGSDDFYNFFALIEETDNGPKHIVDRKTVVRGYELATESFQGDEICWSTSAPLSKKKILSPSYVDEDSWDFDAGDADIIIQLGLFGEVVYG